MRIVDTDWFADHFEAKDRTQLDSVRFVREVVKLAAVLVFGVICLILV